MRPFSYDAVTDDAPQVHCCCAPAEPVLHASAKTAPAVTASFLDPRRVSYLSSTKTPCCPFNG
jgi:hypothetical protein